jgi:DNA-binding transcriptional ArsR family regulator
MRVTTFEALADDTRRRIVELLALTELPAGEIAESFDVSGPAVSRHLRVLREAEVVRYRRDGQRWVYSLDPRPLIELDGWIRHNVDTWRRRFAALGDHLDDMEAQEESSKGTKR